MFDEYTTQDETSAFGRGSWIWAQLSSTLVQVVEKDAVGASYELSFETHDTLGSLGNNPANGSASMGELGGPTEDVVVSIIPNGGDITVSPSKLTFTTENWRQSQSVTVTAVTNNRVDKTYVRRASISHIITTGPANINFADLRVRIPNVEVDVIDADFDATPKNLRLTNFKAADYDGVAENKGKENPTGGMISMEWEQPDVAEEDGNADEFSYVLELTGGASFQAPTVIRVPTSCNEPGCTARTKTPISFPFEIPSSDGLKQPLPLRSATLTVRVRQTDFDDPKREEWVERIVAIPGDTSDFLPIIPLRENCQVGASKTGFADASTAFPCVDKRSLDLKALRSPGSLSDAKLDISVKISPSVDYAERRDVSVEGSEDMAKEKFTDSGGKIVPLLQADIELVLVYQSNDEVYHGPHLNFSIANLKHSSRYYARVATVTDVGLQSEFTETLQVRTTAPSAPSKPVNPAQFWESNNSSLVVGSSSPAAAAAAVILRGGSASVLWHRPVDTGGAPIVAYHVNATKQGASGVTVEREIPGQREQATAVMVRATLSKADPGRLAILEPMLGAFEVPSGQYAQYEPFQCTPESYHDHANAYGEDVVAMGGTCLCGDDSTSCSASPRLTLFGLEPWSTYDAIVYAVNDVEFCAGPGPPSSPTIELKTVRPSTPGHMRCLPPQYDTASNAWSSPSCGLQQLTGEGSTTGGSISLRILRPEDTGGHANLYYDVQHRRLGSRALWTTTHGISDENLAVSEYPTVRITGLKPNTEYEFRARPVLQTPDEDPFTLSATGCECVSNRIRTDCACCRSGSFLQCPVWESRMICYDPQALGSASARMSPCSATGQRADVAAVLRPSNGEVAIHGWKSLLSDSSSSHDTNALSSLTSDLKEFTFEVWIRAVANVHATDDEIHLFNLYHTNPSEGKAWLRLVHRDDAFKVMELQTVGNAEGGTETVLFQVTRTLNTKAWVHVALVRSNTELVLYLDGVRTDAKAHNGYKISQSSLNAVTATMKYAKGDDAAAGLEIDEVRFFTESRTIETIQSQLSGALTKTQRESSALVLHQTFNGGASGNFNFSESSGSLKLGSNDRLLGPWMAPDTYGVFRTAKVVSSPSPMKSAPTSVGETGGSVSVTFLNSEDNGGTPITKFRVWAGNDEKGCPQTPAADYLDSHTVIVTGLVNKDSLAATITGLDADRTYGVCAAPINSVGYKATPSPRLQIKLTPTVPGRIVKAPTAFLLQGVSSDELTMAVMWEMPDDMGGLDLTNFTVKHRVWDTSDAFNERVVPIGSRSTNFTVAPNGADMVLKTHYEIVVSASNRKGEGADSDALKVFSFGSCLEGHYGDRCASFALCNLTDAMTRNNPLRDEYCGALNTVVAVSTKHGDDESTDGRLGGYPDDDGNNVESKPVLTLQKAMTLATAEKNRIFLYPTDVEKPFAGAGYCNVTVPSLPGTTMSLLGIRNGSADLKWTGTVIDCTRFASDKTTMYALNLAEGAKLNVSGLTFVGAGIRVQARGTLTGSRFDIYGCNSHQNEFGGAFLAVGVNVIIALNKVRAWDNAAVIGGGAIAVTGGTGASKVELCEVDLLQNKAMHGGAVYLDGGAISNACSGASARTNIVPNSVNLEENEASGRGGALYVTGPSDYKEHPTVSGITVRLNKANAGGGVAFVSTSNANIEDTFIGMNEARMEGGGGLYVETSTLSVHTNVLVKNNMATSSDRGSGGGVLITGKGGPESNVRIIKVLGIPALDLTGNNASNHGGAVSILENAALKATPGTFLVDEVTRSSRDYGSLSITRGEAKRSGGAVYMEKGGLLSAKDAKFIECTAGSEGGAIASSGTVELVASIFRENTAGSTGGAIAMVHTNGSDVKSSLTLTESTFSRSSARETGGDIFASWSNVNLAGVESEDAQAGKHGGCLYVEKPGATYSDEEAGSVLARLHQAGDPSIILKRFTGKGSKALDGDGGCVFVAHGDVVVEDSTFQDTTASENGGAIAAKSSLTVTMKGSNRFYKTKALKGRGGGISVVNGVVILMHGDAIFEQTSAQTGGGALCADGDQCAVQLLNVSVQINQSHCSPKSDCRGGAIEIRNGALVHISPHGLLLTTNTTGANGGCASVDGNNSRLIVDGSWKANVATAQNQGGVLHVSRGAFVNMKGSGVARASWISPEAGKDGGALYVSGKSTVMIDGGISVKNCRAGEKGGALHISGQSQLTMRKMLVNDCQSRQGAAVYASDESSLWHVGCSFSDIVAIDSGGIFLEDSSMMQDMSSPQTLAAKSFFNCGAQVEQIMGAGSSGYAEKGAFLFVTTAGTSQHDTSVDHFTVRGCHASYGGGVYVDENVKFIGRDLDIQTCSAAEEGGAMYIAGEGANVFMTDSSVANCRAGRSGGGFYVSANEPSASSSLALDNVTVLHNLNGGIVSAGRKLDVTSSLFANNTAGRRGGGALHALEGDTHVQLTVFYDNYSPAKVGADMLCSYKSHCTIEESVFYHDSGFQNFENRESSTRLQKLWRLSKGDLSSRNEVVGMINHYESTYDEDKDSVVIASDMHADKGGALAVVDAGTSAKIVMSGFFSPTVESAGAALYIESALQVDIESVTILDASASEGGAVHAEGGAAVTLTDSLLKRCNSRYDGGSIQAIGAHVTVKNTTFENNRAGIFGGAISVSKNTTLILSGSKFRNNFAWLGGAMAMDRDSSADVVTSSFTDNTARAGGAFYVSVNPKPVTFSESTFSGNAARFGAALFVEFAHVLIKCTNVVRNKASLFGAIRVTGRSRFDALSSTISENAARSGAALYVDDDANITLHGSTDCNRNGKLTYTEVNNNVGEQDGAVFMAGSSRLSVLDARLNGNRALGGDGGAIVRREGARVSVDAVFKNNYAKLKGGAVFLGGLLCRSAQVCREAGELTAEYEACIAGSWVNTSSDIGMQWAREDSSLPALNQERAREESHEQRLEPCSNVVGSTFYTNEAASGAAMYWHRQWEHSIDVHGLYLPCKKGGGCIFGDFPGFFNLAVPCSECNGSQDCESCISNIATDTQTIAFGWTPGNTSSIQSGNPIHKPDKSNTSDPEQSDVYLVAHDYYQKLSRLDQISSCIVERYCQGTDNCFEAKEGVCSSTDIKRNPLAANKLAIAAGAKASSSNGFIRFSDLIIKGDPRPDQQYHLRFVCQTAVVNSDSERAIETLSNLCKPNSTATGGDATVTEGDARIKGDDNDATIISVDTPTGQVIALRTQIIIDMCSPGSELTGNERCERCIAGKYSNDGLRCTTCPEGGRCEERIRISQKSTSIVGVAVPTLMPGYWNHSAPPKWHRAECEVGPVLRGTVGAGAVVTGWGDNRTCQPGSCGEDEDWNANRLHRCRTKMHFYKCQPEEACFYREQDSCSDGECSGSKMSRRFLAAVAARNLNASAAPLSGYSVCTTGYKPSPKCGVCMEGYHRSGNGQCVKCLGDDPVVSKILYSLGLSLMIILSFVVLFMYLRDGGLKLQGKFLRCRRCCLGCCGKSVTCCKHRCCCCIYPPPPKLDPEEEAMRKRMIAIHNAGRARKRASSGDEPITKQLEEETVWIRPEKWKILLSFLQVFQEFRRTYRIKWPDVVQDYMEFFSGLVDFDIFRLTSVDCIFPYTYIDKVWFVVVFPTVSGQ